MIASNSREACFAILFISYVLSVEVPLQDCSKGQNPETWIPVMSFLDSLHPVAEGCRNIAQLGPSALRLFSEFSKVIPALDESTGIPSEKVMLA